MFVVVNNFQFCRDLSVYFAISVIKLRKMLYFLKVLFIMYSSLRWYL